jgi:hypothetical protein
MFTTDLDIIHYFSQSQCYALAYELHKLTGWSLVLISSEPAGSPDYSGHVFVVDSDGFAIDIKGKRTIEEVRSEWYFCTYTHRFFTLKEYIKEIQGWSSFVAYNKDREAKKWAKHIVKILQN